MVKAAPGKRTTTEGQEQGKERREGNGCVLTSATVMTPDSALCADHVHNCGVWRGQHRQTVTASLRGWRREMVLDPFYGGRNCTAVMPILLSPL